MVHAHFQWPSLPVFPPLHGHPLPYPEWTLERWNDYQALLQKAREYDVRTGQADCPDPAKEARFKEIEQFMRDKYGLGPRA